MTDQVPVVWLNETGPHRDEAARALADWARARGVILSTPPPPPAPIAVDPTVADRVEKELAQALSADDADAASRALGRAEALLREHPEAPAAPFLRAEVARTWSRLRLRQGDEAGAAALWQDAEALDGGRVAGIGEKSVAPSATVPLKLGGVSPALELSIDGRPPTGDVRPGEHAVVAKRDGAVVYAAWVAVRGPLELTLPIHDDACGSAELSGVRLDGERVVAPGATCPSWVAAVPSEHGVSVARCERDRCAPLVEWRAVRRDVFVPTPRDRSRAPLPAWATWTVVGISAATVASVVLVAAGAFESRPVETRFVVGGSRPQ